MNYERFYIWLNRFAEQADYDIFGDGVTTRVWVTKARGDYITHVGMENGGPLDFLFEHGVNQSIHSIWGAGKPINIGYSPAEGKWYGWSHRAIFGFGIGSTCVKGNCHYVATNPDDFLEDMIRFWDDSYRKDVSGYHDFVDDIPGVTIEWTVSDDVPNEEMRGIRSGSFQPYPEQWGNGEWTAETLADARQMAIDFADGVA